MSKAEKLAKEKFPYTMWGIDKTGVERYRAGFISGYKVNQNELIEALEFALSHLSEASNEISRQEFLYIENVIKNSKDEN